jgi:putative membrane protein
MKGAMKLLAQVAVAFVALLHVGFLVLEMFFWDHAVGERVFGLPRDVLRSSAALAANQGLYNGFLAAGLVWGLVTSRRDVKVFFLACIVVAGVFGAATAKVTILFTQAVPALVALALVLLAHKRAR